MSTLHDFEAAWPDGTVQPLAAYRGQVALVVNTASRCGFTPQYAGLEALQQEYAARGFTVLGFPCNQFGRQEPGDAAAIGAFCATNYAISFPLFAKVEVNGPGALKLFAWLQHHKRGLFGTGRIKWNFTKFLVGREGQVLGRFAPTRTPARLRGEIEAALGG